MRDGIAAWKATGAALHLPTWSAYLADGLLQSGAIDEADAVIDESIGTARGNGDLIALSLLYRLKGMAHYRAGRPAEAETHLLEARAIAARQRAKLFELCAARDLARLWAERGEPWRAVMVRPDAVYTVTSDTPPATMAQTVSAIVAEDRGRVSLPSETDDSFGATVQDGLRAMFG